MVSNQFYLHCSKLTCHTVEKKYVKGKTYGEVFFSSKGLSLIFFVRCTSLVPY